MQAAQLPEVGKIYRSLVDPDLILKISSVDVVSEADNEGHPAVFFVEACRPEDWDDMQAMGYEFHEDEWLEHVFIPHNS